METHTNRYTSKNGQVKYYATYRTAWNAAIRLNENAVGGSWFFEGDEHGWYLHFENEVN